MERQICGLGETDLRSGLRGKISPASEEGVRVSQRFECASLKVAVEDVVCYDQMAGVVRACASDGDGKLFVIVAQLQCQGIVTPHSHKFRKTPHLLAWCAESSMMPPAWYIDGADVIVIW